MSIEARATALKAKTTPKHDIDNLSIIPSNIDLVGSEIEMLDRPEREKILNQFMLDEALKAITINAAEILGVANRVGSLDPGKDADIVILDGFPLSVKTKVDHVYIDGALAYSLKK